MYYVEIVLRNGSRIAGVISATSERHALHRVRSTQRIDTPMGERIRSVFATRTY